jgi:hypothetical protein
MNEESARKCLRQVEHTCIRGHFYILYWSTKSKVGDKPNQSTIDFPAELVDLLKHADVEGKKFTWNLQLNDNTITNLNKWDELRIPRKVGSSCCTFSDSCFTYITNLLRRMEL